MGNQKMTDSNLQLWAEHLLLLALLVRELNSRLMITCATKPAQRAQVLVKKDTLGNFVIVKPIAKSCCVEAQRWTSCAQHQRSHR